MSPGSDEAVMDLKMRLERAERLLAQTHRCLRMVVAKSTIGSIEAAYHAAEAMRENERHYPTLGM